MSEADNEMIANVEAPLEAAPDGEPEAESPIVDPEPESQFVQFEDQAGDDESFVDVSSGPGTQPDPAPAATMAGIKLDRVLDVSVRVTAELGRTSMVIREVINLAPGTVIELNKLAGEPVDIRVNDRLLARGEVVVIDDSFGVRITEIINNRNGAAANSN